MIKNEVIKILKGGGVGVIPSDTLYGIVGSALKPKTLERIYKIRSRNTKKPCIILISNISEILKFGIKLDKKLKENLSKIWPGRVSVVLPVSQKFLEKFKYLHRGTKTLSFRLPPKKNLLEVLKKTGPLIAPSANPEGKQVASNIKEAKRYFGEKVDFYVSGKINKKASTIIFYENEHFKILREGSVSLARLKRKIPLK